jgi:hypothetical protein
MRPRTQSSPGLSCGLLLGPVSDDADVESGIHRAEESRAIAKQMNDETAKEIMLRTAASTTGLPSERRYAPLTRRRGADAPRMPFAGDSGLTDAIWPAERYTRRAVREEHLDNDRDQPSKSGHRHRDEETLNGNH